MFWAVTNAPLKFSKLSMENLHKKGFLCPQNFTPPISLATTRNIIYCHLSTITVLSEVGQDVIVEQATEGVRRSNLLGCSDMTAIKDSKSLHSIYDKTLAKLSLKFKSAIGNSLSGDSNSDTANWAVPCRQRPQLLLFMELFCFKTSNIDDRYSKLMTFCWGGFDFEAGQTVNGELLRKRVPCSW